MDSDWLFDRLELEADDVVLDVAAAPATWPAGSPRACAPSWRSTPPRRCSSGRWIEAKRAALRNVVLMQGDAAALPFVDGSFDVVVSRFACTTSRTRRCRSRRCAACCARAGGSRSPTSICDPDPAIAEKQNALERLRDPSHTRMLPLDELADLVGGTDVEFRDTERSLEPWLTQTQTTAEAAEEIRAALRADLAGGAATGFRPRDVGGDPRFLHTMASVIASGTLLPGP